MVVVLSIPNDTHIVVFHDMKNSLPNGSCFLCSEFFETLSLRRCILPYICFCIIANILKPAAYVYKMLNLPIPWLSNLRFVYTFNGFTYLIARQNCFMGNFFGLFFKLFFPPSNFRRLGLW